MSQVKVFMPKFKLDISLEGIVEILKGMGMQDAFNSNTADFSGIRDEEKVPGLFIMDIVHKAFVEVNEEGTEAAAATGVVMSTKAAAGPTPQIPVFRADKPFIYMILHKPSNTLLFLGKLNQPPQIQD
jgi:serpin B